MAIRWVLLALTFAAAATAHAQSPQLARDEVVLLPGVSANTKPVPLALQLRWQKDQVVAYTVKHVTSVAEVVDGAKREFGSRLELTKRYRVLDIDDKGTATLDYSVTAMRNEQTRPDGEILLFDSNDFAKSTPGMREQLAKFVGTTLAVLRVSAAGAVVEVKQGPADRYASEPPFTVVLPRERVMETQSWVRRFDVTLNPPLGTGEKFAAEHTWQFAKLLDGKATLALKTRLAVPATQPIAIQEQIALIPKETHGEVVFDVVAGAVLDVQLSVDRTVQNHDGEGSSYRYQSTYTEQRVAK